MAERFYQEMFGGPDDDGESIGRIIDRLQSDLPKRKKAKDKHRDNPEERKR